MTDRAHVPLRLVLVSTERGWHGGEEQARLLLHGLRERGHQPSIMARDQGRFAQRLAAEGFAVETFRGRGSHPAALRRIRRHLRDRQAEVVHFNDAHALTCGGLAAWGLPIPARMVARRVDFPVRSAIRYRYLADRVIGVSQAVLRVCHESGIPHNQLRLVHDGVDPNRIAAGNRNRGRSALQLQSHEFLLLCVATLTDHKGHRFLLEALPKVLRDEPRARLALVGDGDLTEDLRRQTRKLGLEQFVRFLGYRSDVTDLIHAADLFVLPSHLEGLCTSLIDAMLARRPIVTTTAGGIPDLVGSDERGSDPVAWMVPPRDPPALAAAILEAMASPQHRRQLTERARQRALKRFTAERMVEGTLEVYRELLAEPRRGAA